MSHFQEIQHSNAQQFTVPKLFGLQNYPNHHQQWSHTNSELLRSELTTTQHRNEAIQLWMTYLQGAAIRGGPPIIPPMVTSNGGGESGIPEGTESGAIHLARCLFETYQGILYKFTRRSDFNAFLIAVQDHLVCTTPLLLEQLTYLHGNEGDGPNGNGIPHLPRRHTKQVLFALVNHGKVCRVTNQGKTIVWTYRNQNHGKPKVVHRPPDGNSTTAHYNPSNDGMGPATTETSSEKGCRLDLSSDISIVCHDHCEQGQVP